MPEEGINPVALPEEVVHVWNWFMQLHSQRGEGMSGGQPISHVELLAFFAIERIIPEGWEPEAIRRLDRAALETKRKSEPTEER